MATILPPTPDNLTALLQSKDEQLFDYLYKHYSAALFGVILKVVRGDDEMAQDLLQEAFTKIWRNLDKYDTTKGTIFTWMLNVARNTAIDYTRTQHFKNKNQTTDDLVGIDANDSQSLNIDAIGLRDLLQHLTPEQQRVLEYIYFKGFTHEETAEHLQMPLGTVKTRVRKAIMTLREYFV